MAPHNIIKIKNLNIFIDILNFYHSSLNFSGVYDPFVINREKNSAKTAEITPQSRKHLF